MDRPAFCKVIPMDFSSSLKIPHDFVNVLKGEVEAEITIKSWKEHNWIIEVEWVGAGLHLRDGWVQLLEDHNVEPCDFLVFSYNGGCEFELNVFGKSGCEKGEVSVDGECEEESSRMGAEYSEGITSYFPRDLKRALPNENHSSDDNSAEKNDAFPSKTLHVPRMDGPKLIPEIKRSKMKPVLRRSRRLSSKPSMNLASSEVNQEVTEEETPRNQEIGSSVVSRNLKAEANFAGSWCSTVGKQVQGGGGDLDASQSSSRAARSHTKARRLTRAKIKFSGSFLSEENASMQSEDSQNIPKQSGEGSNFYYRFLSKRRPVTSEERERAFQAARAFMPKNPFFMVVMKATHVYGVFYVQIPYSFANAYLLAKPQFVILEALQDWYVKFSTRNNRIGLSRGWADFVWGNHLDEGDVCVFELVKKTKLTFKVHIFRVVEEIVPLCRQ